MPRSHLVAGFFIGAGSAPLPDNGFLCEADSAAAG